MPHAHRCAKGHPHEIGWMELFAKAVWTELRARESYRVDLRGQYFYFEVLCGRDANNLIGFQEKNLTRPYRRITLSAYVPSNRPMELRNRRLI